MEEKTFLGCMDERCTDWPTGGWNLFDCFLSFRFVYFSASCSICLSIICLCTYSYLFICFSFRLYNYLFISLSFYQFIFHLLVFCDLPVYQSIHLSILLVYLLIYPYFNLMYLSICLSIHLSMSLLFCRENEAPGLQTSFKLQSSGAGLPSKMVLSPSISLSLLIPLSDFGKLHLKQHACHNIQQSCTRWYPIYPQCFATKGASRLNRVQIALSRGTSALTALPSLLFRPSWSTKLGKKDCILSDGLYLPSAALEGAAATLRTLTSECPSISSMYMPYMHSNGYKW